MCGRYYIATAEEEEEIRQIIKEISDKYKNNPELAKMKTGEIFPTDVVPVITSDFPMLMKWGFDRYDGKGQVINARVESVNEKPMFKKPFAQNRCLIPASYFFEWEKVGTKKQKYALGLRQPIYMAGIYRFKKEDPLPEFVIITRPAATNIAFIHDRMPVILPKEAHKAWLSQHINELDVLDISIGLLSYKVAN